MAYRLHMPHHVPDPSSERHDDTKLVGDEHQCQPPGQFTTRTGDPLVPQHHCRSERHGPDDDGDDPSDPLQAGDRHAAHEPRHENQHSCGEHRHPALHRIEDPQSEDGHGQRCQRQRDDLTSMHGPPPRFTISVRRCSGESRGRDSS